MGKSERVDAMPPTAWNDDLLELVNQLGIERFHLAGSALGARIALRASLSARERVMSLTIDAPILFETPEGSQAIETMFGGELPEPLAASIERANGHDWRQVLDSFLRIRQTPGLKELYDFRGELGQLRCPALVCRGDIENVAAPISHSLQAHAEIADSRLWIEPSTPFSALHFAAAAAGGRVRDFLLASAE
jgi:pimeloyl-ACP methyl ester carboxylesterase